MSTNLLDLSSLSITDPLDIADQCRLNGASTNACGPGLEADDFRCLIARHADNNNSDIIFKCGTELSSRDNGCYNKHHDDSRHLIPVTSSDVLSIFTQDEDGDTDLHVGIIHKLTALVMLFVSAAPNSEWLNIVNLRLQTPLHLSVITEQVNIVRQLMTAGARVDVTDLHGNTPLHIACRECYVEIAQCLLQSVYIEDANVRQYDYSYQRTPQELDKKNHDGHTCLHLAAMSTHLKVLELLLSKGADINSGDGTSGRTVLHYAAETGNRILLHFLLSQRKINISCRTFGDLTPLRLAAGRGYGDVVTILLAYGADVTDIDESDD